ncbi:hypothetical protein AAHC03_026872 [Spirometra sp. Aus1]
MLLSGFGDLRPVTVSATAGGRGGACVLQEGRRGPGDLIVTINHFLSELLPRLLVFCLFAGDPVVFRPPGLQMLVSRKTEKQKTSSQAPLNDGGGDEEEPAAVSPTF